MGVSLGLFAKVPFVLDASGGKELRGQLTASTNNDVIIGQRVRYAIYL